MNGVPRWTREFLAIAAAALVGATACGGSGSGIIDAGVDAVPEGDAAPPVMTGDCEEGGRSSSDRYLPFDVGNQWRYQVVDQLGGGAPEAKSQSLEREFVPEGEEEPVILQVTRKASGTAENWLRLQGDTMVRLQQQDFDELGNLERTSYYIPFRTRLDENPDRLVEGATWSENWVRLVEDPTGEQTKEEVVSDQWTVLGVDVPCETGWGEMLSCLHVRRVRLAGGKSQKEYYFARGYGKVREEGGQIELLIGCNLQ